MPDEPKEPQQEPDPAGVTPDPPDASPDADDERAIPDFDPAMAQGPEATPDADPATPDAEQPHSVDAQSQLDEIDALLATAESLVSADGEIDREPDDSATHSGSAADSGHTPTPFELKDFSADTPAEGPHDISILRDVNLKVHIELGQTRMYIEDVLKLTEGSVVELDNLAGDPVNIYVNDRLVARGEVLVLSDNFCVRISEILSGPQNVAAA